MESIFELAGYLCLILTNLDLEHGLAQPQLVGSCSELEQKRNIVSLNTLYIFPMCDESSLPARGMYLMIVALGSSTRLFSCHYPLLHMTDNQGKLSLYLCLTPILTIFTDQVINASIAKLSLANTEAWL